MKKKFFFASRAFDPSWGWSFGAYVNHRGTLYGIGWNPRFWCVNLMSYRYNDVKLSTFSF